MELDNLGHRGRTADVIYGLPGQGRPVDLPGRGMSRTSGNKDGDAVTFSTPECTGHRGHFGGGKHPPPTFPLMQHSVTLDCVERNATCH